MFSDGRGDKVAYFGSWSDAAQDRQFRKEALRLCRAAMDRCAEQDLRQCRETQAALSYLSANAARAGVLRFHAAHEMNDPEQREHAVRAACKAIARAVESVPSSADE